MRSIHTCMPYFSILNHTRSLDCQREVYFLLVRQNAQLDEATDIRVGSSAYADYEAEQLCHQPPAMPQPSKATRVDSSVAAVLLAATRRISY